MLVAGYWMLVTGYWMLVTGYWMLVSGYSLPRFLSGIYALLLSACGYAQAG